MRLFRRKPVDLRCVRCGCPESRFKAYVEEVNRLPYPFPDEEARDAHDILDLSWGIVSSCPHLWIAPEMRGALSWW